MTKNGRKLTNAYKRVRMKNRNQTIKKLNEAFKEMNPDDIRGSTPEFVGKATALIYEAKKTEEFLATLYFELLELFETGQADDNYQLNAEEILSIALVE